MGEIVKEDIKDDSMGFQRGQVWFKKIDDSQQIDLDENKYLVRKDRPYLIITDNQEIENSPVVNCVPILTDYDDTKNLSCDVQFYHRKQARIARCSQVYTFDKALLSKYEKGNSYMYTISEDIMKQVDLALVKRLGLYKSSYDLTTLYTIVDKIVAQKEIELQKKYTEVNIGMIQKIADRMDDILGLNVNMPTSQLLSIDNSENNEGVFIVEEITPVSTVQPNRNRKSSKHDDKGKINKKKSSKTREESGIKWGIEKEEEFLDDYGLWKQKLMTLEEILAKYNIKNVTALYSKNYILDKRKRKRAGERII